MNWKEEYCKKFGLCELQPKYSKCTCNKELNYIRTEIIEKLIEDIKIRQMSGGREDEEAIAYKAGYGTAQTELKILKQQLRKEWL